MLRVLRQRNFALLWFGGLISVASGHALFVALPFYIYQLTGSAFATGLMFIAQTVPGVLLGSLAGVFVDRWDLRRTMVVANLSQAALLVLLLAVRSSELVWLVYVVGFFQSVFSQFFGPAENALLPRLVDDEHLVPANSLNALNNNLGLLIGASVGGVLMGGLGLTSVVLFSSASRLVAGALITLISRPPGMDLKKRERTSGGVAKTGGASGATVWREWLAGLRLVGRSRVLSAVFVFDALASLTEGFLYVLLVPFVELLGGGAPALGWIVTLRGLGGMAGGLIVGLIGEAVEPARLFPLSMLAMGLLLLLLLSFPHLILALIVFFTIGVPAVAGQVSAYTLLQTNAERSHHGRVFGSLGTTGALCMLLGQGIASGLGDRLGVVPMLSAGSVIRILASLIVLVMLRGATVRSEGAA